MSHSRGSAKRIGLNPNAKPWQKNENGGRLNPNAKPWQPKGPKSENGNKWESGETSGNEGPRGDFADFIEDRPSSFQEKKRGKSKKICKYHLAGNCTKGKNCNFSHGPKKRAGQHPDEPDYDNMTDQQIKDCPARES